MEKYFMAALTSVEQLGPKRMRQLLKHFGSARVAWSASEGELLEAGLPDRVVQSLLSLRQRYPDMAEEIMTRCESKNIRVCSIDEEEYPDDLRSIDDAPLILYYKGTLQPSTMRIAMVGTRQISRYGEQVALEIAEDLARTGITIVSGGAAGIDSLAHRGALKSGRTISVLGCGIENVYPAENRRLFERIVENGALISEYPPRLPPSRGQFLRRNRIIAGLSKGVVIVEAGEQSGALDTANHAIAYERTLFAVPGSIYAKRSLGCNNLIKYNGAILTRDAQDILSVYNMTLQTEIRKLEPLSDDEMKIFELVPTQRAAPVDEIIVRAEQCGLENLSVPYAVNVLNALQLKGYVMEDAVGSYLRTMAAMPSTEQIELFDVKCERSNAKSIVEKIFPVDKKSATNKIAQEKKFGAELDGDEAIIFNLIDHEPLSFDDILLRVDKALERAIEVQELNQILFALELKGLLIEDDLGNYARTNER